MNIIKPLKAMVSISALCSVMLLSSPSVVNASGFDTDLGSSEYYQKRGKHHKHMMKKMIKKLELSEQQQIQIKAIKEQAKEQKATLRASMPHIK